MGRRHDLSPGGIGLGGLQKAPGAAIPNGSLIEPGPKDRQIVLALWDRLNLNAYPQPLGHPVKLGGRLPRLFEGQQAGADAVAVQAHRHLGGGGDEVLQNGQVLPGKVREAVDVEYMVLGVGALFQLLQQPGHLIPGVPLAPAAQGIVALHQQGQLLQLLGKAALGPGGGFL